MLFLNQKTVTASVALTDVMDTIEKALIASEKPENFVLPLRTNVVDEDGNILMLMPCLAEHAWGLKILTIFSGNPAQGKPYIDG
ncbi:MAG: ornithine cyclodeaminase family protein, partial [Synergistaceae bacterium]|nr:ornithine cyclodeaminase family protein [Synergistaceae bacterium]